MPDELLYYKYKAEIIFTMVKAIA